LAPVASVVPFGENATELTDSTLSGSTERRLKLSEVAAPINTSRESAVS
jgi:hypothetical protein